MESQAVRLTFRVTRWTLVNSGPAFLLAIVWAYALFVSFVVRQPLMVLMIVGGCYLVWHGRRHHWIDTLGSRLARFLSWLRPGHVFFLALMLRLAWIVVASTRQVSDFAIYDKMALDILRGRYIVEPSNPTGASILIAGVYALFGYQPVAAQVFMAILGSVQATLVYALVWRIKPSRLAAGAAGTVFAVWPSQIVYASLLSSDTPYTLLILVSAFCFFYWVKRGSWFPGLLFGVSIGVAHWVRPLAPVFLAAGLVSSFVTGDRNCRERVGMAVSSLVGFALLVLPIAYLNYQSYGYFTPVPILKGAASFVMATNVQSPGGDAADYELVEEIARANGWEDIRHARELDSALTKIALARIAADPLGFLRVALFTKPVMLWNADAWIGWATQESRLSGWTSALSAFTNLVYRLLLTIAAIALVFIALGRLRIALDRLAPIYYMTLSALFVTVAHMIQVVQPRYHYPLTPFLAILVGLGVAAAGRMMFNARVGDAANQLVRPVL